MPTHIDFLEIFGEESFETWVASLKPWASSPDIFADQDPAGRYTSPVHQESQAAALVPSAKLLCPADKVYVTLMPYNTNNHRTKASWARWKKCKGAVEGVPETLMMHSVKLRVLSDALRDCFFRYINNELVPNYSELVVLCDFQTTYAITHFFLTAITMPFVERKGLNDFGRQVRVALLSSRDIDFKLKATKVMCMDVVPSSVLYKIVRAVPTARIEVLIFSMKSHDLRLAQKYYHTKPTNGGRIVCEWCPRNFMNAFECIAKVAAEREGKEAAIPHTL